MNNIFEYLFVHLCYFVFFLLGDSQKRCLFEMEIIKQEEMSFLETLKFMLFELPEDLEIKISTWEKQRFDCESD